jgi:molecular chaperone GrpE
VSHGDDTEAAAPAEVTDLDPANQDTGAVTEEPGALDHDGLTADDIPDDAAALIGEGGDVAAERDEYLEALRRVKAEFDNYKKRTDKERVQMVDRANEHLVAEILPVLDACDAAVAHGDEGVAQIRSLLFEVLGKGGLELMEPEGEPFDPTQHEAVLHEDGDGGPETVAESLRAGYTWRGRVIRPAMVKVRG